MLDSLRRSEPNRHATQFRKSVQKFSKFWTDIIILSSFVLLKRFSFTNTSFGKFMLWKVGYVQHLTIIICATKYHIQLFQKICLWGSNLATLIIFLIEKLSVITFLYFIQLLLYHKITRPLKWKKTSCKSRYWRKQKQKKNSLRL